MHAVLVGEGVSLRTRTMPRLYILLSGPQERDDVWSPHARAPKATLKQLEKHGVRSDAARRSCFYFFGIGGGV